MTAIQTKKLRLLPHVPAHLRALLEGEAAYESISGTRIAEGVREFLLAALPDFFTHLQTASSPDPWKLGLGIMDHENTLIGMCGFTGPPDLEGVVKIGYSIAPGYESRGYATEASMGLIDFAATL